MKRLSFYLVLSSLVTIPTVVLISFLSLALLTYGSLHKPESFAKPDAGWMPIAKAAYYNGVNNNWQMDKNCAVYDDALLYIPSSGCSFENPEFTTTLSFDENGRKSSDRTTLEAEKPIFVLGDSFAMGWGVNDNETYSYWLERHLRIPVYNLGVSSYGTVREISRGIAHPQFDASRCVIIHYRWNDFRENQTLLKNGALPAPTKARFEKLQNYQPNQTSLSLVAGKTFHYLKKHPYKLFWFLGDWKWHISEMIPLLRKKPKDEGGINPVDAALLRHADVFLKVLEAFPELRTKFVMVLGDNWFVDGLINHSSRPRNVLPLKLNNIGHGDYFPLDGHYNSAGHRNVALSILEAFERDTRFSNGCGIDVDGSHGAA